MSTSVLNKTKNPIYVKPETYINNIGSINDNNVTYYFKKVELSDINRIKYFIEKSIERTVDYTLGGIFMWVDYFNYEFCIREDTLYLRGIIPETGMPFFHLPLVIDNVHQTAHADRQTIFSIKSHFAGFKVLEFSEIESSVVKDGLFDSVVYNDYSYGREYIYTIDQFDGFKGKKMEKKRNHLNKFCRMYPEYHIEMIDEKMKAEIMSFNQEFQKLSEEDDTGIYENRMSDYIIQNYELFNFDGIVIRIGNRIAGYTFGEKVGDTFYVHVEKGYHEYDGIYQALASNLCQIVKTKYPDILYVNREEDMGEPQLIKSKESYHPYKYIFKNYF